MKVRILVLLSLLLAGTAHAQDASLKKAQDAFDQAQVQYVQGNYDAAADGFKAAYQARAFPQFLYNIGAAYHMKGKKLADAGAYAKAVDYYQRYLSEEPRAADREKVEKSIKVLEAEIERLKAAPPPPPGAEQPKASDEVQQLGDVRVRGLIVIESEPQGASIYIDGKDKGELAKTPWSGSLDGEHTYIVEKRGYKSKEGRIAPDPTKLLVLQIVMAEEDYLGWVDIRSNVPGAEVFVDDRSVGAIGKTPYSGNFKPGKHTFWVSADGYDDFSQQIEVVAGEAHEVSAQLKGAPVGYLNLRGTGIERSTILVDGKVLCERGPCRKPVREGQHTVTVRRSGYKPYTTSVEVQARTELSIRAQLARKPGRGDAVAAYIAAGVFAGAGAYLGTQSQKLEDELERDIANGAPPPDSDDPRFQRGKIFAISADGAFAVSGLIALTAIYYTFRDKGAPSTGQVDVRAIALEPQVGPGYAGLGAEVHW